MIEKSVRSVLNKHKKRDTWFLNDYSVNPYEGCSCNCLYCYIRGSKYGENMDQDEKISHLLEPGAIAPLQRLALFDSSNYPPFSYQEQLQATTQTFCVKYNIRNNILL